jgi:hypothetical protein
MKKEETCLYLTIIYYYYFAKEMQEEYIVKYKNGTYMVKGYGRAKELSELSSTGLNLWDIP